MALQPIIANKKCAYRTACERCGSTSDTLLGYVELGKEILSSRGSKIVMITALDDHKSVFAAYGSLCDGYLAKPIDREKLLQELRRLELIS